MLTTPVQVGQAEVRTSPPIPDLPGRWHARRQGRFRLAESACRFRTELGLTTDRAIVLTGHQAVIWHPGILAKYIAADRLAVACGGAAAWIIVAHDAYAPDEIIAPLQTQDDRLTRMTHRFAKAPVGERIASRLPAFAPNAPGLPAGHTWPIESIADSVAAIDSALARSAHAGSAVEQVTQATIDLAGRWLAPAPRFDSLQLARTTAFAELVEMMRLDSVRAADSYNRAVGKEQGHGIAPLSLGDDPARIELPLWRIDEAGRRHRVFACDLSRCDPADLAPRALLMTGLIRRLGCDLFIHGTGGAAYDRVTDAWFADWLNLDPTDDLAPNLLVTATLRLPFDRLIVSEADVESAQHRLRRMLHDPAALGEVELSERKRELVEQIASLPRRSGERAELFARMQSLLREVREEHADRLSAARAEVQKLRGRLAERSIIEERTWPFPLYAQSAIDELAAELTRRMQ